MPKRMWSAPMATIELSRDRMEEEENQGIPLNEMCCTEPDLILVCDCGYESVHRCDAVEVECPCCCARFEVGLTVQKVGRRAFGRRLVFMLDAWNYLRFADRNRNRDLRPPARHANCRCIG